MPITISLWILIPIASALYMAFAGFTFGILERNLGKYDDPDFDRLINCLMAAGWPITVVIGVGLILPMHLGLSLFESFTDTGDVKEDEEQKNITPLIEVETLTSDELFEPYEAKMKKWVMEFCIEREATNSKYVNARLQKITEEIDSNVVRERATNLIRFRQQIDDIEERFNNHVHQVFSVHDPSKKHAGAHNNHHFAGTPMFGYNPETDQHAGPVFTTMCT